MIQGEMKIIRYISTDNQTNLTTICCLLDLILLVVNDIPYIVISDVILTTHQSTTSLPEFEVLVLKTKHTLRAVV